MTFDASSFDRHPVDVRGPLKGSWQHRQTLTSFARAFVHDGHLYIAESRDLGGKAHTVTAYPVPDVEPSFHGNVMRWGDWTFSGCTSCRAGRSKWKHHTKEALLALVTQDA